ncbi:MAG: DUF397 domain-containing protein [Pseudonocardiaceae bacterium]
MEITTELLGWVGVRDSKLGTGSPVLPIAGSEWRAILAAAQTNELGPARRRTGRGTT